MNLGQFDKIIGFAKRQAEFWRDNTPYMNDANVLISVTGQDHSLTVRTGD